MNARPQWRLLFTCLACFILLPAGGEILADSLLKNRDKNDNFTRNSDFEIPNIDLYKIIEESYNLSSTDLEAIKRFAVEYNGPRGYWPHNHSINLNLFEGDIANVNVTNLVGAGVLPREESSKNGLNISKLCNGFQKVAILNKKLKWPEGRVPYVISSYFSSQSRKVISNVFAIYHRKTCIEFVPHTDEKDYIEIKQLPEGCSSSVGRQGGAQTVSLGLGCVQVGVIEHELMHVLGFLHEQSRPDRDKHVIINWFNIQPGTGVNFMKIPYGKANTLKLPYDIGSIMHYGPFDFAVDPFFPTIIPRKWVNFFYMGQRNGVSLLDVKKINRLYDCAK